MKQDSEIPGANPRDGDALWLSVAWPGAFSTTMASGPSDLSLPEPATRKLAEFFEKKGLLAIKQEDQREQWYDDWLAYLAEHQLYVAVLSPKAYSTAGRQFDLLRYARFIET